MPIKDGTEFKEKLMQLKGEDPKGENALIIADMIEFYDGVESASAEKDTKISTLTEDNESIRRANMELFKRIGFKEEPETKQPEPKEEKKVWDFSEFINAKGGLK